MDTITPFWWLFRAGLGILGDISVNESRSPRGGTNGLLSSHLEGSQAGLDSSREADMSIERHLNEEGQRPKRVTQHSGTKSSLPADTRPAITITETSQANPQTRLTWPRSLVPRASTGDSIPGRPRRNRSTLRQAQDGASSIRRPV